MLTIASVGPFLRTAVAQMAGDLEITMTLPEVAAILSFTSHSIRWAWVGGSQTTSNAISVKVNAEGKIDYAAQIARVGRREGEIVHSSFKDLIPMRHRAEAGELSLDRPSAEEVIATKEKTAAALQALVTSASAAQRPKNIKTTSKAETYVRYQPAQQFGEAPKQERLIKIRQRQVDPVEPPKHRIKKVPRGPPSPPPPVMRSPPRKLTAEDQAAWRIPPPVSNWKNPKGYTIALDKRLAADGRHMQDTTINDKFASFAEALSTADRHAREEVKQRNLMQQRLAEKEKAQKEEQLRKLAQQAREERAAAAGGRQSRASRSVSRSRSASSSSRSESENDEAARAREEVRKERRRENERQLRQSRMGTERRIQMMAREQNRDISEKIALGLAKPTQTQESMYDSRLFNQTSGFNTGFNEDQPYDKPLFAAQDAISSIYRPKINADDDDGEDAGETMAKIQKSNRFEVLGKAKEGFKGAAEADVREGPVQFDKDTDDPFGISQMISETTGGAAGSKRYGMHEAESRSAKRARVDDDER